MAVVITTYRRGLEFLPALLRSLTEQTHQSQEVTVVVDGGDPGVLAYLGRDWPSVDVVSTPAPRGFAGAAALGVASGRSRYIAMVNDNVELEPRWLELLVGELERCEGRLGFLTGKTLLYDDRELIDRTKQDLYTCGRFVPCGLLERDEGQWDRRLPATVVSASTCMYRRHAVEAAGGFDEDYFMYCEDADGCLRMVLAGYRGLYVTEAGALPRLGGHDRTRLGGVALLHGPQQPDHAAQGHAPRPPARQPAEDPALPRTIPSRWPTGMPPVPA